MPRRLRRDHPGAIHHVMSRGIARRTIFETRRDVRFLLACLARQVRLGDLEVLAYSILTTHFHLLVRSPRGRLSAAMQRALDAYARWFNRSRRRDGPLFRSRFVNRLVESDSYAMAVVRYIDHNAVSAGLVDRPEAYPHGSASKYARARGPAWLSREPIQRMASGTRGRPWNPADYARCFSDPPTRGGRWLVGRRLDDTTLRAGDPLDELLASAPDEVRAWMAWKARLADGTSPGWPVVSPRTVTRCVDGVADATPLPRSVLGRSTATRRELLLVGILRTCSGLRLDEIARRLGRSPSATWQRIRLFQRTVARDAGLLDQAARVLEDALAVDHPSRSGRRTRGASRAAARAIAVAEATGGGAAVAGE